MNIVTERNAVFIDSMWITEASDLQLKVGTPFPMFLETDLGNKKPFVHNRDMTDAAIYFQQSGSLELHVLND